MKTFIESTITWLAATAPFSVCIALDLALKGCA